MTTNEAAKADQINNEPALLLAGMISTSRPFSGLHPSAAVPIAAQIIDAIHAGRIPGIIASAPPCARMCEAQAVKVTMDALTDHLTNQTKRAESFAEALRLTAGFVGACVGPECTDMFHRMVPAEVDLVVKKLRATRDTALARVALLEKALGESLSALRFIRADRPSAHSDDAWHQLNVAINRGDPLLTPQSGTNE